jgi:hypothetical protein
MSMDKKDFERLEKHVFDEGNPWDIWKDGSKKPNKLPYFANWVVYDKNLPPEQVVNKNINILKGDIVFVGLNFSKKLKNDWGPWRNIRGDKNFDWLLDGKNFNVEKYRGAYITDIIKDYIGSVAFAVMKQLDKTRINKNIEWFLEEIEMLPSNNIEMYLFGVLVKDIFEKYIMNSKEKFDKLKEKVKKCQQIQHYSRANPRFRIFAPSQLGLVDPPVEGTKMNILWNDLEP